MQPLCKAQLGHVSELLQGMVLLESFDGDAQSLSPPHERALARAHGLDAAGLADGLIPWAAWERSQRTPPEDTALKAWAFVTPCHWAFGREQAILSDPEGLALTEADSRTLMAAMQGYFEQDGIALSYGGPDHWLAEGAIFRQLPTASLDRAIGRSVDPWLPDGSAAKTLRRLQNEMQMLLYTHPLNDLRQQQGLVPVNTVWFSGTGDLPEGGRRPAATGPAQQVMAPRGLARAMFTGDWAAYAAAWTALDAGAVQELLSRQGAGQTVRLTLCGERSSRTWQSGTGGLIARLSRRWSAKPLFDILETL